MFATAAVLLAALSLQGIQQAAPVSQPAVGATAAAAVRAVRAPVIDGRDADEIWRTARPITEFTVFDPTEGGTPRYPTEARVAYDDRNFYVFVRAFDPEPGTIQRQLARRDEWPATDHIVVMVDSYHDHRSGFEFGVTPSGGKIDVSVSDDGNEDAAWDGVWEVVTRIDSIGWTAEFRIPLSQLRYADAPTHTFGFGIVRDIMRFKERVAWPQFRRSRTGMTSQLGDLSGLDGIPSPRRLEVLPYVVTKNVRVATDAGFDRSQRLTGGADVKFGITSNLTLDGTVNPDFGQVEADPAVLNITAFETFYEERRPFFIEGNSLLRYNVNSNNINGTGEGLYYSRRIGRAPQLSGAYGDERSPTATTILGAAKLTGRLPGGLSLGVLDAVTQRHTGTEGRTIEPGANYALVRATQDLRGGETTVGLIGTAVNRSVDEWSRDYLRESAYVGGLSLRHRFLNRNYQIQVNVTGSRVAGSAAAIATTQRSSAHYYQRPDAPLGYDATRTALAGDAEQIKLGKMSGRRLVFETSYQRISAGYEINDLGYLQRADWQTLGTWVGLRWREPTRFYRSVALNLNGWNDWTASGLPLGRFLNSNTHIELPNKWWLHAGGTYAHFGAVYDDRAARGGPAVRRSQRVSPWLGVEADPRRAVSGGLRLNYTHGDEGRTTSLNLSPQLNLRVSSQWSAAASLSVTRNRNNTQWYGNYGTSDTAHYTFARLVQRTASLQLRVNYTASPTLTLQMYAEPFVSKGRYSDVRELASPRAAAYADRFHPYGDTAVALHPRQFNVREFRSNVVLRWEYSPGSTVYLVWTQGRSGSEGAYGTRSLAGDLGDVFGLRPNNTFLVKVAHWLNW